MDYYNDIINHKFISIEKGIDALLGRPDQNICDFTLLCRVSCKNCTAVDDWKRITVRYLHSNLSTQFEEGWIDRSMEHQIYKRKCCPFLTNSVVSKIHIYPKILFVVHSSGDNDENILPLENVQSNIKFFEKIYILNACIYLNSDHYTCKVYSQHFNDILFNDPTTNNAMFTTIQTDKFPFENIKLAIYVDKEHFKGWNNNEDQTFDRMLTNVSGSNSVSRQINFFDHVNHYQPSIECLHGSIFDGFSQNNTPLSISDNILELDGKK
jgi:hypothetical protein